MAYHKGLDLWNIGSKLKFYRLYLVTYHKWLDLWNIGSKKILQIISSDLMGERKSNGNESPVRNKSPTGNESRPGNEVLRGTKVRGMKVGGTKVRGTKVRQGTKVLWGTKVQGTKTQPFMISLDIICRVLKMIQCSKDPALYDIT